MSHGNTLTPRNDRRATSIIVRATSYNIQYIVKLKGDENRQMWQPKVVLLI